MPEACRVPKQVILQQTPFTGHSIRVILPRRLYPVWHMLTEAVRIPFKTHSTRSLDDSTMLIKTSTWLAVQSAATSLRSLQEGTRQELSRQCLSAGGFRRKILCGTLPG